MAVVWKDEEMNRDIRSSLNFVRETMRDDLWSDINFICQIQNTTSKAPDFL